MGLLELIILTVVVGFVVFLINRFTPIDGMFKQILTYGAAAVLIILWIVMLLNGVDINL